MKLKKKLIKKKQKMTQVNLGEIFWSVTKARHLLNVDILKCDNYLLVLRNNDI
jgi:hypothetical protein